MLRLSDLERDGVDLSVDVLDEESVILPLSSRLESNIDRETVSGEKNCWKGRGISELESRRARLRERKKGRTIGETTVLDLGESRLLLDVPADSLEISLDLGEVKSELVVRLVG